MSSARARHVSSRAGHPPNALLRVVADRHVDDLDVIVRLVLRVGGHLPNRLHDVEPAGDPAKHGVLVVKPRRGCERDEKLRAIRIRAGIRLNTYTHAESMNE